MCFQTLLGCPKFPYKYQLLFLLVRVYSIPLHLGMLHTLGLDTLCLDNLQWGKSLKDTQHTQHRLQQDRLQQDRSVKGTEELHICILGNQIKL